MNQTIERHGKRIILTADDGHGEGAYEVALPERSPRLTGIMYLVIKPVKTGYRVYWAESHSSYSTAFGHGGHCIHYTYRAVRSALTGLPLGSFRSHQDAMVTLLALWETDDLLP